MSFTKIDNTHFVCDLYELYKTDISAYVLQKVKDLAVFNNTTETKFHFDLLFLTPSNLVSDYYKTNINILADIIDGISMVDKHTLTNTYLTDVTSADQVYMNED